MAKTICFTGHRPKDLFGYDEHQRARYSELTHDILNLVRNSYKNGYKTFITGGAQGADQLHFGRLSILKKNIQM